MLLVDKTVPRLLHLVAQVGDDGDNGARAVDDGVVAELEGKLTGVSVQFEATGIRERAYIPVFRGIKVRWKGRATSAGSCFRRWRL